MDLIEIVKIPKDRIAVLIGKNGSGKKKIETLTETKISIDSKNGEIQVRTEAKNSTNFYSTLNIVKGIGRGFSPENALLLIDSDYYLDLINLEDEVGHSEKAVFQKKGRIIGTNGKTRSEIEEKTDCFISIYGKTVAIIGKPEKVEIAREAIEMILHGASHDTVYHFLKKKNLQEKEFSL